MIELQSNELDCTTNLRQIFDRLLDPLQAKWRKSVKLYRERTCGKEPSLKELSAFITGEPQTENDPVYGRPNNPTTRVTSGNRSKKSPFILKPAGGTPITTMATEVLAEEAWTSEVLPAKEAQSVELALAKLKLVRFAKARIKYQGGRSFPQRT